MLTGLTEKHPESAPPSGASSCEEKRRLLDEFLKAVRELNDLQTQQTQAVVSGDPDFSRFDVLIHLAQDRKDAAKYAWIAHVETHRCEEDLWH
jgi:hypothetical protein